MLIEVLLLTYTVSDLDEVVSERRFPAGSTNLISSVSEASYIGAISSTVHVTVTLDPTGRMGLTGSLVTLTDLGRETKKQQNKLLTSQTH